MAFEADTQTGIEDNNGMANRHDDANDGGWLSLPLEAGAAGAVYVTMGKKKN